MGHINVNELNRKGPKMGDKEWQYTSNARKSYENQTFLNMQTLTLLLLAYIIIIIMQYGFNMALYCKGKWESKGMKGKMLKCIHYVRCQAMAIAIQ